MRVAALVAILLFAIGCAQASPRFSADVQTAVVSGDMQRLETKDMRLYYPASDREEALRVAARFEACLDALRTRASVKTPSPQDKANIVLAPLPLNNAYVQPGTLGLPPIAVVPTFDTSDVFAVFGLPPDPAPIGCHEMVHYVQFRQLTGLPADLEAFFGYGIAPELGLEPWFSEGLAVYYETRLQKGIGRLGSAFWNGAFAAGVATHGLSQSDVDFATRRVPYGAHYLVGSHFIDWLVRVYGEPKLWDVIERQSDEVVPLFGVGGRFKKAYGKSLGDLYRDFARDAVKTNRPRPRPASQHLVQALDQNARLAAAPDGTWAVVHQGMETPARLLVGRPDGTIDVDRDLTDVLPGRELLAPTALGTSGMSFTADGRELWMVVLDRGKTFQTSKLVKIDPRTGALEVVSDSLGGAGGSIAPDGSRYWFSLPRGDSWELASFDTKTKTITRVASYGARAFAVEPRIAPDGARLAVTFMTADGPEVRIVDARDGRVTMRVPAPPGATMTPAWIDADRLAYAAERDGALQILQASLAEGSWAPVTNAPHLAWAPAIAGDRVFFLDREGWTWSLDAVTLGNAPTTARAATRPSFATIAAEPARDAPVEVLRDAPYRATELLFVPTLRGPSISTSPKSTSLGLGASGGDRLGYHRWALEGSWDVVINEPNGDVEYIAGGMAPVFVRIAGEHSAHATEYTLAPNDDERGIHRESSASLLALRSFWTTTVTSGLRYDDTTDRTDAFSHFRRAAGAFASVAYLGQESTPAAGARRAFAFETSGTFFPQMTGPAFGDARAALAVVTPLPLSRRHTMTLSGVFRALPGLAEDDRVLEVGGASHSAALSSDVLTPKALASTELPAALRLTEPLRGFEDRTLLATRVATAELLYRMPIVFDWGTIQTTPLLPSFLLRQLDVEAFGSGGSLLDGRELAFAAGGALVMRTKVWLIPIDVGLQAARRLTYDEAWTFSFVGTGTE